MEAAILVEEDGGGGGGPARRPGGCAGLDTPTKGLAGAAASRPPPLLLPLLPPPWAKAQSRLTAPACCLAGVDAKGSGAVLEICAILALGVTTPAPAGGLHRGLEKKVVFVECGDTVGLGSLLRAEMLPDPPFPFQTLALRL